ncbi:MAG: quinone-dependent dihydroorotate dehydrogenase [Myxococcales bacterium]|nr:quinone-dependent dihydroorotate dehydrogenase [Myxococcales bacterium]
MPAEAAHEAIMRLLRFISPLSFVRRMLRGVFTVRAPELAVKALGQTFPTPLGLGAGFDKNAEVYDVLADFGFAFVEVGTVTWRAQAGNPQPRLFRLPKDRALINRMGFNNVGAEAVAPHLEHGRRVKLGLSVGKSRAATDEETIEDYGLSLRKLARFADYVVLNVSSPNTPGLRSLQSPERLEPLLVESRRALVEACPNRHVPLLLKVDPDLSDEQLIAIGRLALEVSLDGIIATNTTVTREGLASAPAKVESMGAGGLSGPVLAVKAKRVLRTLKGVVGDRVALISVGGIETGQDAWERICAGASLVQIYTGFIWGGPLTARRINRALLRKVRQKGLASVQDAIGHPELAA